MKFKSVAARIIVFVLPVVALTMILSAIVIFITMSERIDAQFNERMQESLLSAEERINAELALNANVARNMAIYAETSSIDDARNGNLVEFVMRAIPSNRNTVGGGIWFNPYSIFEDQRYFEAYVYVEDGVAHHAANYANEVDYHSEDWFISGKTANGQIVWSGVYHDPVPNITMITATMPIYNDAGEFWGVTTADMSMSDIQGISDSISIGNTGAAFIVGADGEYITFLDDSRSLEDRMIDDEDEGLAELGRYVLEVGRGTSTLHWNDAEYRVFFTNIEDTNWHLIVLIDEAEVGQSVRDVAFSMVIIPIAGLILTMILLVLTARYLQRVARKVNSFAVKAASGDLSERIDVTETDEFGVMERSLNQMMDDMAEMTQRSEESLKMAQEANRAKTDFLSNMSHEMRTPLNAIIGMTTVAEASKEIKQKDYCLEKIDVASKHLLGVINDILDMSKIEADMFELSEVDFNFEEMLEKVSTVIGFKVEEKKQTMMENVDKDIPPLLKGDDQRLAQVITNLLGNAVKFTPEEGTIQLDVKLLELDDSECVLQVDIKDSGIGISKEKQAQLFSAFVQADNSTARKYGGTGLGLVISKRIVEMMGGTIWVESEEGMGSLFCFTIRLKVSKQAHEASGAIESENATQDEGFLSNALDEETIDNCFEGKCILLAEDIEINREIVLALLEPTKIEIDCAETGLEALEMFKADPERYDLIFSDIQMPEMDGYEATREIRKLPFAWAQEIAIVAMTANVFREDIDNCLAAGMTDHIGKPVDVDAMIDKLRKYLR